MTRDCHLSLLLASKPQWPELSQLSLCSEFNKENLMEFSLNFLLLIHFTTMAMHLLSYGPHVTLSHVTYHDLWRDHLWPSITSLWHCDNVMWYVPVLHLVVVSPIRKEKKRKEKKRNINNDLADLPSHDIYSPAKGLRAIYCLEKNPRSRIRGVGSSSQVIRMLSQSLDDLGTTQSECLGRTRWSSPLDCTTYLYYFYRWLYTTSPRSHVLSRMFYNHMTCHVIWLCEFPCYLYLVFVVWLDICDQVFEHAGNFLLLRALIT